MERQGDLTTFIASGTMPAALGMGPESVQPWRAEAPAQAVSADDLFGDSQIPIVLVGTSYSANVEWGFAEALKTALGSDVLNVAEEGLGPVAPMRAYLASDGFRDQPPTTVIWEFPIRYLATPGVWDEKAEPTQ